ncbi:calpain-2 catalytic subunit-like isoform X1 [Paramisgurnus dabryanus]|uniref:calpain-2 catalytic subunit-like isoform X1 n=1 Tax=Paramisgurnus dabryanus TaxID=90735 RepID=UPI0031F3E16C
MSSTAKFLAKRQDREDGVGTNKKPRPFKKQDYQRLKRKWLKKNTLFCDPIFPAGSKSLGYKELGPNSSKAQGVEWKRPKELCANPQFIVDGAKRTDICQGALGDCWLLAAIASLTLNHNVLCRVVPPDQSFSDDYAGIFHFQFWQYGEWVDVVVDDRLPTKKGKLLFVHSAERSEFWSALLEKAYAKVNGSYEALSGGRAAEGFEDFTGGIAEIYMLSEAPPDLFKIIQKALGLGSLLGCAIVATNAKETEAVSSLKLIKGHAYSVTGAVELHCLGRPVQLVRLRNPWGDTEWTGAWSDNSSEWKNICPEERAKLNYSAEDGEFWMTYSDFLQNFSRLEICNLTPDTLTSEEVRHWNYCQFDGNWKVGCTAGGCINNKDTFSSNPQFVIKLEDVDDDPHDGKDGCTLLVGLMQKDVRKDKHIGRDLKFIGFYIYKVPDEFKGRSNVHLNSDVLLHEKSVEKSKFISLREICKRFKLPPGEYVILPSTFEPNLQGSFILRVFTEKKAVASPMDVNITANIQKDCISESDVDPSCKELFMQFARNDSELSVRELQRLLKKFVSERTDIKSDGFSKETCRHIISLLDKNGSGKLGLLEFHKLWMKIQRYLEIFKKRDTDKSGTMSSFEMRDALNDAGFQVNGEILQVIILHYADQQQAIDFDNFVGCLIHLEMRFKTFQMFDKNTGKVELDILKWLCLTLD